MSEYEIRKQKYNSILSERKYGFQERFESTIESVEFSNLTVDTIVCFAGRVVAKRNFGNIIFMDLYDAHGTIQVSVGKNEFNGCEDRINEFKFYKKNIDLGDIVGVSGENYITKTGEQTIRVRSVTLLSKSLRPLPEKFHGIENREIKYKQRYLDLISSKESREVFIFRNRVINEIRSFLINENFMEFETPILQKNSLCLESFKTYHNDLDIEMYLRRSPEVFLKKIVMSGFNKVFEIGKSFKNENTDSGALHEFTTAQLHAAYWNSNDIKKFSEKLLKSVLNKTLGFEKFIHSDIILDFSGEWRSLDLIKEINKMIKHDISNIDSVSKLKKICLKYELLSEEDIKNTKSVSEVIVLFYERKIKPNIIQPTILYNHPATSNRLPNQNDNDLSKSDAFHLVAMGTEILRAYSNASYPILESDKSQICKNIEIEKSGICEVDETLIQALEYGVPPMSGVSLDIDKLIALICNQKNLKEVILFPITR